VSKCQHGVIGCCITCSNEIERLRAALQAMVDYTFEHPAMPDGLRVALYDARQALTPEKDR